MTRPVKTSAEGKKFIKLWEKKEYKAYPDPKTGGAPWTIGYGHTGPDVKPGMVWNDLTIEQAFEKDVAVAEGQLNTLLKTLKPGVEISQGLYDALLSFGFNCGFDIDADTKAEGLGDSTLLKCVLNGNFAAAYVEFEKWVSKGTPAEKGLRRRRYGEVLMARDGAKAEYAYQQGRVKFP